MATYVFLNIPGQGHVNPTLAVAQELVRRGERVIYYLTEEYRAAIESTGAIFRGYESHMGHLQQTAKSTPGSVPANPLPFMMVDESAYVLPHVFERIRADRPDCILYDTMCLWAKIAARSLHVPAVMFRPSYASNGQLNPGRTMGDSPAMNVGNFFDAFAQVDGRLAELCRVYGVEPFRAQEMLLGSEALTIVFIPREFQPGGETFDEQRFVFVGPSIKPRPDTSDFPFELLVERTTFYISLGTVFNNQAAFYNMCFAAFKDEPWQVVLSTGRQVDPTTLDPIPANFLVRPHVPQLEVLQHSSLFVTHCGMNSTMESLYYGVPMVGIPQMPEQMMTAQRIQELGLGTVLDEKTLTVEKLHATFKAAISNADYRTNAQVMQQHVRNAGGYKRAADAILNFAQSQRQAPRMV